MAKRVEEKEKPVKGGKPGLMADIPVPVLQVPAGEE